MTMKHDIQTRLWVLAAIAVQLTASGCRAGGGSGGLFGLFGGDSGAGELLPSAGSGGPSAGGGTGEIVTTGGPSGGSGLLPAAAVVHNPEPGSLALFGSGLVGAALWRRRKARKRLG